MAAVLCDEDLLMLWMYIIYLLDALVFIEVQ